MLSTASHLEERLTVSQSVRQSDKQAGRQKHTVWLFSVVDHSYPSPLLSSKQLRVTVPSAPRGNLPQMTVPSAP